jgi:F0F1-type ATP synthase assembly protein I
MKYQKIVLISLLSSLIVLAVFWFMPFHWSISRCCDLPTSGTYYGWPLVIKSVSCCGFAGNELKSFSWISLLADYMIYLFIIFIILVVLKKLRKKRGNDNPQSN